ncbi:phospholipase D [Vibrio owensii]|uniref:Phospholipase D n=1 Tax=Vibrio owensii CAIM 1854 = LMG 25443 TaxID=1229493 RepID=A0A0C1W8L7_9VIBR|nr:phospholipase D [Vibrio owensii]KIF52732.1 phospholipase D [Vibrio owensii CAIM 1854 = LMG 25443]
MTQIELIKVELSKRELFYHDSDVNYVRLLDTPNVWGMPFGPDIMPRAIERQKEFERAIVEIVQKTHYRCDISSLNSPDPDWARAILGAIDTALTTPMGRNEKPQFRFLFGQTPLYPINEPDNLIDFKAALVRLIRTRSAYWEIVPEFVIGRYYQRVAGSWMSAQKKFLPESLISDSDTKMTWNHTKIIACDGVESLVGGHNLNMDLFRSYPPVHDVSAVVHGAASFGAQKFLNELWNTDSSLLTKESLDTESLIWNNKDGELDYPHDPFELSYVLDFVQERQNRIQKVHETGIQPGDDPLIPPLHPLPSVHDIRNFDLRSVSDLDDSVFEERQVYNSYDKLESYKKSERILTVGKYWTGLNRDTDFKIGSEIMKKNLILNAKHIIRMSQQDVISAWKKNWKDHVVCHWIIDALLQNEKLTVQIVVSPLDAGAGVEGDQYSFGSGAIRTFGLMEYYMTHDVHTDQQFDDSDGKRRNALSRLFIAPFFFTDKVPEDKRVEGETYKWPDLPEEGKTATLKALPLSEDPPAQGMIGHPFWTTVSASGFFYGAVDSAPGNHAKIMIVDDEVCIVGSDNLYPGNLAEINYLMEGEPVNDLLESYWKPLWQYSSPYAYSG